MLIPHLTHLRLVCLLRLLLLPPLSQHLRLRLRLILLPPLSQHLRLRLRLHLHLHLHLHLQRVVQKKNEIRKHAAKRSVNTPIKPVNEEGKTIFLSI